MRRLDKSSSQNFKKITKYENKNLYEYNNQDKHAGLNRKAYSSNLFLDEHDFMSNYSIRTLT